MPKTVKILYLEDDSHIPKLVQRLLNASDITAKITWVNNKVAFEDKFNNHFFDLILADYSLPDFDGLKALNIVREKDQDIPFILFSGSIGEEKAIESLRIGCTDYVLKQNINALVPAIKRALTESREKIKRREVQKALEENELKLRSISAAALDGIIMMDTNGRISFWNEAAGRIFGYTEEETIGKDLHNLLTSEENNAEFKEHFPNFIKTGNGNAVGRVVELTGIRKDGRIIDVELSLSATKIKTKWNAIGVIRDITERKKTELVQKSLLKITSAAISSRTDIEFYRLIHEELRNFLDTRNLSIGLYNKLSDTISFPYSWDEQSNFSTIAAAQTLCGYVIEKKKSLLLKGRELSDFKVEHHIKQIGQPAKCWMGIPLIVNDEAVGIMLLQSYDSESAFTDFDLQFMKLIASQASVAIRKKEYETELQTLSRSVEQSPLSVVITGLNGDIQYANPAFCRITGYTQQEVLGKNPRFLKSGETNPEEYKSFWETISRGEIWQGIFHNRKKDGTLFWEDATIGPVFDESNQIIQYIALKQDITKQKEAEGAFRRERHMLESLMNNMPDQIYFKDEESRFIRVNRGMLHYHDFKTPDEIINKTDFDLFALEHAEKAFLDEKKIMETREPLSFEEREIWPDGREAWVSTVKAPLEDENGKLIGTFGISRNITERKSYETALKNSEDRLRIILESVAAGIMIVDAETLIVNYVNPAALKMMNRHRAEVLGQRRKDFIFTPDESESNALKIGEAKTVTDGYINKTEGDKLPILKTVVKLQIDQRMQLIESFVDIRKLRETEQALSQAQKLESIGQLAAGIAHEINTPTQFVGDNMHFLKDAFSDLLNLYKLVEETKARLKAGADAGGKISELERMEEKVDLQFLTDEIPKALDQSLDGIERISKIVKAMKEFSHPGSKDKTQIDINKTINNTITVSRNEWKYVADVVTEYQDNLPLVPLYPDKFNQVILNLIINAAHAITPKNKAENKKGIITIKTSLVNDCAEIRISDNGTGIPKEIQKKIFDPFFTTKAIGKGTGQGLAISHDVIVNKHNGSINLESVPGKGTSFIITLPLNG